MNINIKKDWKFFGILTLAVIIITLIVTYTASFQYKLYKEGKTQGATGVLEEANQGTQVEQKFIAENDNLKKISIDFEPYKTEAKCGGEVTIGIKDNEGNIIKEKTIIRNYVRENYNYILSFKKQKNSKDKEYTIYIQFKDLEDYDKFYTLKTTDINEFKENKLYVNGEERENTSLIFQALYKSNKRTLLFTVVLIVMIIGTYIISTIIYYKKDMKIENIFLMVVPFVAILFIVTMPTFKNHDEYYHWLKAYEVSTGHLMTPIKDGVQGSLMPGGTSEIFAYGTKFGYKNIPDKLKIHLDKENEGILNPDTAAVYSFVPYIPQAIGIFIGRLVTDNAYLITYAGRIINMLVAIFMLYLAIKIMPFGKKILLIPAMIPIAIEGFTSLSPDAMTISMSFLYIAYIFKLAFGKNEKVELKEKIILLIMSIIVALCKIVYLPLVGLILIIPKDKFKNANNKNKIFDFFIIAGLATIVNLTWLAIAGRYLSNFNGADSKIKVLLALQNPIEYIQSILYTINFKGSDYLLTLFGRDLGWEEFVKLYAIVPYVFIAIYLFTAITDDELKDKLKKYQLIWITLIVLAVIVLVFTSLYVQWSTIGADFIQGVQGRYFLPILPLVMILLGSILKVKTSYKKENINKFTAISALTIQIFTIVQIVIANL